MTKSKNIFWQNNNKTKLENSKLNGHKATIIWFTGLSGSGKSTLAKKLNEYFYNKKIHSYILDGDNIRHGLNKDLGFSPKDRTENIRRIGEVSKLFVDSGTIVLTAFISPYKKDRNEVRELVNENEFIEIFVKCSVEDCEKRDPKGLYKKVRNGEIKNFTGITAPYEEPKNPELILETDKFNTEECLTKMINYLIKKEIINN